MMIILLLPHQNRKIPFDLKSTKYGNSPYNRGIKGKKLNINGYAHYCATHWTVKILSIDALNKIYLFI
jgi:hypothetical protein